MVNMFYFSHTSRCIHNVNKGTVVADVGEVVTVLTVLDVGEVTVVGVVVLSLVHTYGHRVQYFRQIIVHF